MVELWVISAISNAVMVVVYGSISVIMLRGLWNGHQWRSNPLATATAGIFVTCTLGHGAHIAGLFGLMLGSDPHMVAMARQAMSDPALLLWDITTAVVAIWYFTLRNRLQLIFQGAALCEDMQKRQKDAQDLHDNVVQGLVRAQLALDMGQRQEGERAVEETLAAAKTIITGLLGDPKLTPVTPGRLRRGGGA
jgi:signal transduction histidine kinase